MLIYYKPDYETEDELMDSDMGDSDSDRNDIRAVIMPTAEDSDAEDSDMSFDPNASDSDDSDFDEEAASSSEDIVAGPSRAAEPVEPVDDEEGIVQRIVAETKKERTHPPDIQTEDFVMDISFHPISDLLAVGLITGDVVLYKYSLTENTLVSTYETHTKACRDVEFSDDGDILFSASKDKGIVLTDMSTGKMIRFYDDAHEAPIYCLRTIDENLFATGDEDGHLKVWDRRNKDPLPIFSLKEVDDYISCILTNDEKKYLLMTSGDGFLTTVNMRARKLYVQSEQYDEELTSMGLFRDGQKLVAGSSKGKLYSFNWDHFGYHCDAFPAFKSGINALVPVSERMAIMGCEDGILRAANTVAGKRLGVVGQHSMAVETMDISNTAEFVASSSHDNDIRFWNIKYFEEFDEGVGEKIIVNKERTVNLPSSKFAGSADFFSGLANQ